MSEISVEVRERALELHEAGWSNRRIQDELGIGRWPLVRILNPDSYERSLETSRAAKRRRTGVCACGATTRYNGRVGKEPVSKRCIACANRANGDARKVWTREALIGAIVKWAELHGGDPPAIADWNPWLAREYLHDEERALEYEIGVWPSFSTVIAEFGSWSAGIEAAGFARRQPNGGGGNHLRQRRLRARARVGEAA